MKNKNVIISLCIIFVIIFFLIAIGILKTNEDKRSSPSTKAEMFDLGEINDDILDRSYEESIIRSETGNPYYTLTTSPQIEEERYFGKLKLDYIRAARIGEKLYVLTFRVVNDKDFEVSKSKARVIFVNKKGEKITEEYVDIPTLKSGSSAIVSAKTDQDILKAYDFIIKYA